MPIRRYTVAALAAAIAASLSLVSPASTRQGLGPAPGSQGHAGTAPGAGPSIGSLDDPLLPLQWALGPEGLNVGGAWERGLDGSGVAIGILGTGGVEHEDLPPVQGGWDFITDNVIARDGNGRDSDPHDEGDWDFKYASTWRGTHVAGIIQAQPGNGVGGVGVAPGAAVEHLRVVGWQDGAGHPEFMVDVREALVWAAGGAVAGVPRRAEPMDVVLIGDRRIDQGCDPWQSQIDFATAAGTIIVAPASHLPDWSDRGNSRQGCPGMIVVAGTAPGNAHHPHSDHGPEIAVAAPGGGGRDDDESTHIVSTVDAGLEGPVGPSYDWQHGNELAAAHVAGVIALMRQQNPSLTPARIVGILRTTGFASHGFVTGCETEDLQCGVRVDASRAVAVAAGDERMPRRLPPYDQPPSVPLQSGVPADLRLPMDSHAYYHIDVPPGASLLTIELLRQPGDFTNLLLYARHGRAATAAQNDCDRGYGNQNVPCVLPDPAAGRWYVRVGTVLEEFEQQLVATYKVGPETLSAPQVFSLPSHRTRVLLDWAGGSSRVDVRLDGAIVARVPNRGVHVDTFAREGTGTVSYQVCDAGTHHCSAPVGVHYASRR